VSRRTLCAIASLLALDSVACAPAGPEAPRADVASARKLDANSWTIGRGPDLPAPVANNAVAAALVDGRPRLFSFLGLGAGRDFRAITTQAYSLDPDGTAWERLPDVPGTVGRLAATAQAVGPRIFVFGGYEVAADGKETTSPATDIYVVAERRYLRGADAPIPLDDAVSGVWRDRLIYLVSGWSTDRTMTTVQAYDPDADRWVAATPIPGTPVFGHAGGLIDDTLVYCGGAKMLGTATPKYGISAACYRGDIDPAHPATIAWRAIAAHPGGPRYRAAAGPVRTATHAGIMFVGGTTNPYNYDGIGYDGRPAEPESSSWIYDTARDTWVAGAVLDVPTMDHRGLVGAAGAWWIVGGFAAGQAVSTQVTRLAFDGVEKE
jgi:N-acetylneuraminic acid mutarotase